MSPVLHRQPVGRLHAKHATERAPLEAKVTVPTITTAVLFALVGAAYGVAKAFGLELTSEQEKALAGLGLAALPLLQFVVGYYAPHTARPDVPHPPAPAVDTPEH